MTLLEHAADVRYPRLPMTDDEKRVKHLEMIQAVVTRMAQNSFAMKGWAVGIVAALLAFGAKDQNLRFAILAILPCLVFWGLDGYYLALERRYRDLYDEVRTESGPVTFAMAVGATRRTWFGAVLAQSVCPFYLVVAGLAGVVALVGWRVG